MAQKTFVAGDVLTASDVNTYLAGEGGAWTTWTPTVTQSGSVTVTVTRARYSRYGRSIHFVALLAVTGTGTGANDVSVSLPVTAAASSIPVGYGSIYDASANVSYHGPLVAATTTTGKMVATSGGTSGYLGSVGFTAALANTDSVWIQGTYEAAT